MTIDWSGRSGGGQVESAPLSPVYNLLNSAAHAVAVVPLAGDSTWQEVVVASVHNDSPLDDGGAEFSVSISHFPPQNQQKLAITLGDITSGCSATLHLVLRHLD